MSLYADWDPERQLPDYDRHPSPDVRARWAALCALHELTDPDIEPQLLGICEEAEEDLQSALDAWSAKEAT